MANKMLIDAAHPEETRVVVLRGNRVEEFDFESAHHRQLRGNIYLAKVTRVEPSLQAAFVDYGGNRHGFLAFSEIHPDYYQIPIADRQALIDEDQRAQRAADDEIDRRSGRHRGRPRHAKSRRRDEVVHGDLPEDATGDSAEPHTAELTAAGSGASPGAGSAEVPDEGGEGADLSGAGRRDDAAAGGGGEAAPPVSGEATPGQVEPGAAEPGEPYPSTAEATAAAMPDLEISQSDAPPADTAAPDTEPSEDQSFAVPADHPAATSEHAEEGDGAENGEADNGENGEEVVELVGGADALEEVPDRAPRYRRQYKIQEVIKRRQVMLVQVVKEERGTKGAALTTYLSLAGRYSVLMPNTARGGGISRKITSGEDRSRLKEIAHELEVPEGMGVIVRTAGASRTKAEIKRDFEYLLRLWETVRDLTLKSTAPKLVYEEGSLVKRSIRDLYSKEIDEVVVAGPEAYSEAKDFMRMLMPSHAKNVKPYSDAQPLLSRHGIESQLDAMFSPVVQLRSGGYIVLNQAEALVAIDVNSGRATREHHIEDTALKTNMEAADEIARQLRLRDLAGLIVIDFIDMDEKRNNRSVEHRLKDCLKQDRARIQVGRISHFGLLEMSRQRIRASVLESSTDKCPYCGGSGHVRSVSSLALQVLRALEDQLMRSATHNLVVRTRPDVALYVLNQKRGHLRTLEERFAITITIAADATVAATPAFVIEHGEQVHTLEAARTLAEQAPPAAAPLEDEDDLEETAGGPVERASEQAAETASEQREGKTRRRRRRHGRGRESGDAGEATDGNDTNETPAYAGSPEHETPDTTEEEVLAEAEDDFSGEATAAADAQAGPAHRERQDRDEPQGERRRRRRGRRGGRRNRHEREHNGDAGHESERHAAHPAEEVASDEYTRPSAAEPALSEAVADLDATPTEAAHAAAPSTVPEPASPEGMSAALPDATASAEPAPPEPAPPRGGRSTVREPAPVAGATGTPASATPPTVPAEPVITELDEGESAHRPRRTGWWSRRSSGG